MAEVGGGHGFVLCSLAWQLPKIEAMIPSLMTPSLKAETTRPPDSTMERQQKRFDEFRHVYNDERPHEALGQKRP